MPQPSYASFTQASDMTGVQPTRRSSASSCSTIHKASHVYRTLSAFYSPGPLDARPIPVKQTKSKATTPAAAAPPRRLLGRSTRLASNSTAIFLRFFSRSHSCTSVEEISSAIPKQDTKDLSAGSPKSAPPVNRYEAHATRQLDEYHQQHRDTCNGVPQSVLESAILDDLADERTASLSGTSVEFHSRSTSNSFSSAWSPANTDRTDITDAFSFAELPVEPLKLIEEDAEQSTLPRSTPIEAASGSSSSNCSSLHLPIELPPPLDESQVAGASEPEKTAPVTPPRKASLPEPQTQPMLPDTTTTGVGEPQRPKRPAVPPRSVSASAAVQRTSTPPRLSPQPRQRKTLRLFPTPPPPTDLPILPYKRLSLYADADPQSGNHQLRLRQSGRRAHSVTSLSGAHSLTLGADASRPHSWPNATTTAASMAGSERRASVTGPAKDEKSQLREWELATYSLRYEDTAVSFKPFTTKAAAQLRSGTKW